MANDFLSENASSKRVLSSPSRSPNYPQVNFAQALDRVGRIYEKEHTHIIPAEVAAEALGYTSLNGTSKSILSALRKYGLLGSSGDGYRVSEDAVTIIELPSDDPQRTEAIRRSALSPSAFKLLHSKYGESLPSDGTLRHFLVQNNYQSDAANQVIKFFKETLAYLNRLGGEDSSNKQTHVRLAQPAASGSTQSLPAVAPIPGSASPVGAILGELRFHIAQNCDAEIAFSGDVTQAAIDRLIKYLELSKDLYPDVAVNAANVSRATTTLTKQDTGQGDEDNDFDDLEDTDN